MRPDVAQGARRPGRTKTEECGGAAARRAPRSRPGRSSGSHLRSAGPVRVGERHVGAGGDRDVVEVLPHRARPECDPLRSQQTPKVGDQLGAVGPKVD